MYSKEEASKIRQMFWTSFGQYMKPVPSASGERKNWSNYRTGTSDIYFRMRADKKEASIAIELTGEPAVRDTSFQQFLQLRSMLHDTLGEEWQWEENTSDENGHPLHRIFTSLPGVNIMNQADWPAIIAFFKQRMILLDHFWSEVRDMFV